MDKPTPAAKATAYLATMSASGPAINIHRGQIFETTDAALAASLEKSGYAVKMSKGLTLEKADARARKAVEKSSPRA